MLKRLENEKLAEKGKEYVNTNSKRGQEMVSGEMFFAPWLKKNNFHFSTI
jgi:hypothetical protein